MGRILCHFAFTVLAGSAVHATPSISQHPQPITTSAGRSVSFSVAATGSGSLSYQWRRDGFILPGATASTLSFPSVSLGDVATYEVLVSDSEGGVPSGAAALRVSPAAFPDLMAPGAVIRLEGPKNGRLTKVATLPDGRFYVAGNFTSFQGQPRFALARCNADTALDATYLPPNFDGTIDFIAAQPDGRLLVAGAFRTVNGVQSGALARLNEDGSLDRTFAVGAGFDILSQGLPSTTITGLALGPDGSVFVGGNFNSYQDRQVRFLAKLSSTGLLDSRFKSPAMSVGPPSIAVAPDGKVYIAGTTYFLGSAPRGGCLRTLPDGTFDPSFDIGDNNGVSRVFRQADGKILLAGSFNQFNGQAITKCVRVLENGNVDLSFNLRLTTASSVTAIAQASNGDLIMAGNLFGRSVARVKLDGSVDATFSAPTYNRVDDVAALASGRVLVASLAFSVNSTQQATAGIEVLDATGRKTAFDGQLRFPGNVRMIRHQPGGKLIVAGDFTHWNGTLAGPVVRVNQDLTLDPTFRVGAGPNDSVHTGALQPDGKILLLGAFTQVAGTATAGFVRLNADGSVDATFRATAPALPTVSLPPAVLFDGRIIVIRQEPSFTNMFQVHSATGALVTNHAFGTGVPAIVNAATQLPGGFMMLAGSFNTWKGVAKPRFVRMALDGTIDPGFSPTAEESLPSFDPNGSAAQGTGAIVYQRGTGPIVIGRKFIDGRPDREFASQTPFILGPGHLIFGDDRVLLWGIGLSGTNYVARLTSGGAVESAFRIVGDLGTDSTGGFAWMLANVTDAGDIVAATRGGRLVRYAALTRPLLTEPPTATIAATGQSATFSVTAVGPGPFSYQWFFNNNVIVGATSATFTLSRVFSSLNSGEYQVAVTNAQGTTLSAPATLKVDTAASELARLTNLSVRVSLGTAPLITGFAVAGSGKQILLRGIGPGLAQFSVAGVASDPRLALYNGATLVDQNDNWSGTPALAAAVGAVGAFPVPANNLDAMLLRTVEGAHTAQLTAGGGGGVGLVELYDTNPTPASPARLTNASARYQVGTGDSILIAGFVIAGSGQRTLLIRGVGPALAQFGVPNALADPQLAVFAGDRSIAENDNWGGSAELTAISAAVGAFPLPATSRDAAMLITLPVGSYTVQLSGNSGGTGEGLIEIYEVL